MGGVKKPPAVIPIASTPDPDAFLKVPRPIDMEPRPLPSPFPIFSMLSVDRARLRETKWELVPLCSLLMDRTPAAVMGGLRWRGWYGNMELPPFPVFEVAVVFVVRLSLVLECHEGPALPAGPIGMTSIASSILSSSSTVMESGRSGFDNDAEELEEDGGEGDRERCLEDDTGSERSLISSNIS